MQLQLSRQLEQARADVSNRDERIAALTTHAESLKEKVCLHSKWYQHLNFLSVQISTLEKEAARERAALATAELEAEKAKRRAGAAETAASSATTAGKPFGRQSIILHPKYFNVRSRPLPAGVGRDADSTLRS
jgi:septal ring factor EnvC (AmiA/AmiB activator)